MNLESQLQVAFSTIAELRDRIVSLEEIIRSLQEQLRMKDEQYWKDSESLRCFYENMMDNLRISMERQFEKQLEKQEASMRALFEEQIAKLISERDAALLAVRHQRGKRFGGKSEGAKLTATTHKVADK